MDARALIRDVLSEAKALGLGFWERLALIVALAFFIVAGKRMLGSLQKVGAALAAIKPETAPVMDEGGPQPEGQPLDTDPNHPGGEFPVSGG